MDTVSLIFFAILAIMTVVVVLSAFLFVLTAALQLLKAIFFPQEHRYD